MDPRARFGNKNVLIKKQLAQTTFKTCPDFTTYRPFCFAKAKKHTRQRLKFSVSHDYPGQLCLLVYTACNDTIGHMDTSHRHNSHGVLLSMTAMLTRQGNEVQIAKVTTSKQRKQSIRTRTFVLLT